MQRSRSTSTSFMKSRYSGPGTISMQSTGQNEMQASQPVQPVWSMTASCFGGFGRGGLSISIFLGYGKSAMGAYFTRTGPRRGRIPAVILDRIASFVSEPASAPGTPFDELALEAFAFQFERIEPYRRMCEGRGATPGAVTDWRRVPPVPTAAFKSLALAAEPAKEIFRSSGTTGEARSVHHHPYPDLYRLTIDSSFPRFCLPLGSKTPMLSLIPTREQLPGSSLSFMIDHVLSHWGTPESATAFGSRGVEVARARSWCG